MYQIDNSTAVASIPASTAAGTNGYFTDGNPATGVPATIMPAEFMNMLMMENLNVLAAAGITPAKSQFNQLALAIAKIVQNGAAGAASETSAGILKLATAAQALAGTDNTTAITPLKLAAQIQSGAMAFATDTGTANTYVCAFTPAITARVEGQVLRFKVKTTSTGACTINDGLGVVPMVGGAHAALQNGELVASGDAWIQWNTSVGGGSYILLMCTGAPEQVANATQSQHSTPMGQIQSQAGTAFTTAGTAPAFTLTPAPAITALAAGQRFRASFGAAGTLGSNTLNVNGTGAKNLLQFDQNGVLQSANVTSGMLTDVEYNGTSWVVLDPLPAAVVQQVGIQGAAKNLVVSATGLSSIVTISAEEVTAKNATGQALLLSNVFLSVNLANSGLNGLDTGTVAAGGCYSIWAISNGTTKGGIAALCPILTGNTTAGSGVVTALSSTASMRVGMPFASGSFPPGAVILSVDSSTQITASLPAVSTATGAFLRFVYDPVMPSGYTYKSRVSAGFTDGTANKYPLGFTQSRGIIQPKVAAGSNLAGLQSMASGNTSSAWAAVAVGGFVPPTATRICVVPVLTNATNAILVAPNASYGAALSTANPPPMQEYSNTGGGSFNTPKWMNLESGNIYWSTNGATNYLFLFGWEDNL